MEDQRLDTVVVDESHGLVVNEILVELVEACGRYGYRRITALLHREGWRVNHKKVERSWRQEAFRAPRKQPKRGRLWWNDGSRVRKRAEHRDHPGSYDFVFDRTHDGQSFNGNLRDELLNGEIFYRCQSALHINM